MNSNKTEVLQGTRLRSIDALRGLAAIGVVLYHTVQRPPNRIPARLLDWPAYVVQFGSSFGYIGVFLFFVISGFCIHLQWARAHAAGEQAEIRFGAFWRRRIRRLYPPYLIALAFYLLLPALINGITLSRFLAYDVVMHLLMLHNLDPKTCYSINGVFWTLAIEEQLYLAYFLLLFLRTRWGWGRTIAVCLLARLGWIVFSHMVWLVTGTGVPVPEGAASHWFTWALGAIGVEAAFGLIQLPRWCRSVLLSSALIVGASAISQLLPSIQKDTLLHNLSWFLIHPMWGIGFFILVNRAVLAEDGWLRGLSFPGLVSIFATLGVFSYSIYLTHEMVIMQSWRFVDSTLSPLFKTPLVILATILFAWIFFWFCERPYMRKSGRKKESADFTDFAEENRPVTLEPESA